MCIRDRSMSVSFDKTGEYTIYAKASLNIGGKDRIFTTSVKIKVVNKEDTHKVVIDGAHCNQYVTGNYAGKLTKLQQLLQDRGCITTINNNTLTDETLKDAKLLILTDPQSVDDSKFNLKKSKFEKSEIEVIKRYVDLSLIHISIRLLSKQQVIFYFLQLQQHTSCNELLQFGQDDNKDEGYLYG